MPAYTGPKNGWHLQLLQLSSYVKTANVRPLHIRRLKLCPAGPLAHSHSTPQESPTVVKQDSCNSSWSTMKPHSVLTVTLHSMTATVVIAALPVDFSAPLPLEGFQLNSLLIFLAASSNSRIDLLAQQIYALDRTTSRSLGP